MFGGKRPHGFTIVETMIFLGVSGVLFVSVFALISNDQNKTEFFQGIHQVDSQIQSLATNVQNGDYSNYTDFTCRDMSGGSGTNPVPDITTNLVSNQGTNEGCTFIGHILQFGPIECTGAACGASPNLHEFTVYTVIGRQYKRALNPFSTKTIVSNLTDARPRVIGGYNIPGCGNGGTPGDCPTLDTTTVQLPTGLQIADVTYKQGPTQYYNSLVGFFSGFPNTYNGSTAGGSLTNALIPIPSNNSNPVPGPGGGEFVKQDNVPCMMQETHNDGTTNVVSSQATFEVNGSTEGKCVLGGFHSTVINPTGGVTICLQSTGLKNYLANITIGANATGSSATGNPFSIQLSTYTGTTCH